MTGAITGFVSGGLASSVCFVAGTSILAATGAVSIETLQPGDFVWAWDEASGNVSLKEVVETFVSETSELVHVLVNGEEIICTNEHPFYSPSKGWTAACELRAGDILVLVNGEYVSMSFFRLRQSLIEVIACNALTFAICVFIEILVILNPQSYPFWLCLYLILFPIVVFVLSNLIYMERGMFMLRTKMHVDESGIVCTYKHRTIWTCCWNEIEAFQYYNRFLHKCRRIVLFNKNKPSLYFEISKAAQEAISQYCPKTELLENL